MSVHAGGRLIMPADTSDSISSDTDQTSATKKDGASPKMRITIQENGPYMVEGSVPLSQDAIELGKDGKHYEYAHVRDYDVDETYLLCRCGMSENKPFCDYSHLKGGFDGHETADKTPYEKRATRYKGPDLTLYDDDRCAYARLCHRKDGDVWKLTALSTTEPYEKEAVEASWHCPTGRLTHVDNNSEEVYEQDFEPSIVALEDVELKVSGPLFVRGGVPLIGADGTEYETRNRYALCRCGKSQNKPFCDAMHCNTGFSDGSQAFSKPEDDIDNTFAQIAGAADAAEQGL